MHFIFIELDTRKLKCIRTVWSNSNLKNEYKYLAKYVSSKTTTFVIIQNKTLNMKKTYNKKIRL